MSNNPTGFKVTDQSAGWNSADFDDIFVRKDCFLEGGLWLWGAGYDGRLGTNNLLSVSSPVQTISGGTNWKRASIGLSHGAGIKTDGTLWIWGNAFNGRLGTNNLLSRSSPVQTISGGTNWRSINASFEHTAAIKTDGTLWLWGGGNYGKIGNNSTINRSSPVQTISGGTNWKSVSLAAAHTAAIKTDGTLWLWGYNGNGRLGTSDFVSRSSPVQTISGGTDWKGVSIGLIHSAAIKTDGTLWTWGSNSDGQLGLNAAFGLDIPSPTRIEQIGEPPFDVPSNDWKQVSSGAFHSAAIKTNGTLWLWGDGRDGRLGDNDNKDANLPKQTVSGGNNWRTVELGGDHSMAIKTDGTLWAWGFNGNGRLGDNTSISKSSPIQTISGGTNWKSIGLDSLGGGHSSAIREDCW
jgi:alpha-tubulin suppressor-like RCC1 family protein